MLTQCKERKHFNKSPKDNGNLIFSLKEYNREKINRVQMVNQEIRSVRYFTKGIKNTRSRRHKCEGEIYNRTREDGNFEGNV